MLGDAEAAFGDEALVVLQGSGHQELVQLDRRVDVGDGNEVARKRPTSPSTPPFSWAPSTPGMQKKPSKP